MPKFPLLLKLALVAVPLAIGYRAWGWYTNRCCARPPVVEALLGSLSSLTMSGSRPADFALVMYHGTGSLPPVYAYSYDVRIDRSGRAAFTYRPGYSRDTSLIARAEFTIDSVAMDMLWQLAAPLRSSGSPLSSGDIPNGGSSPAFTITSDGKVHEVANWQRAPWDTYARALSGRVRAAIPDSVWTLGQDAQRRSQSRED